MESHLGSTIQRFGNMSVQNPAEDVFPCLAAHLKVSRQGKGEFSDAIVHEGRARFHAHRHASPIDLLELRVYERRDEFMGEHPLQKIEAPVQFDESEVT